MNRASSLMTLSETAGPGKTQINTVNNLRVLHADDHEYVQAMLEDLCDWFNRLYTLQLEPSSFIATLDNGVLLCRLAHLVHDHAKQYFARLQANQPESEKDQAVRIKIGHNLVKLPAIPPVYNEQAHSGTFFARDNVSNFIDWCKHFGVPAYFMFETNDIVLRKNVKNVLLCLLVLARIGSEFGVDVPDLIKLEMEIDSEEAAAAQFEHLEEAERMNAELLRQQEIQRRLIVDDQEHRRALQAQQLAARQQREKWLHDQQDHMRLQLMEQESLRRIKLKNQRLVDMRTLDEVIREMISDCQCDVPIMMKKLAPGKYQIGEDKTMIFVRVLRNHVMVRVGGGWDTFESFLWKRDPCRRHRPRAELQQRAAELLRKNREIFYCEDSDQTPMVAAPTPASGVTTTAVTKRSSMLPSTPRAPSRNGVHDSSSVTHSVPATPRQRRPATVLGQPMFDSPDAPHSAVGNGHADRSRTPLLVNTGTPTVRHVAQSRVRVSLQSTMPNGSSHHVQQPHPHPHPHQQQRDGGHVTPRRVVLPQTKPLSRAGSTSKLNVTSPVDLRVGDNSGVEAQEGNGLSRSELALQKHFMRIKKAQSTHELNSVGVTSNSISNGGSNNNNGSLNSGGLTVKMSPNNAGRLLSISPSPSPRVATPRVRSVSVLGMRTYKPAEPISAQITPVPEDDPLPSNGVGVSVDVEPSFRFQPISAVSPSPDAAATATATATATAAPAPAPAPTPTTTTATVFASASASASASVRAVGDEAKVAQNQPTVIQSQSQNQSVNQPPTQNAAGVAMGNKPNILAPAPRRRPQSASVAAPPTLTLSVGGSGSVSSQPESVRCDSSSGVAVLPAASVTTPTPSANPAERDKDTKEKEKVSVNGPVNSNLHGSSSNNNNNSISAESNSARVPVPDAQARRSQPRPINGLTVIKKVNANFNASANVSSTTAQANPAAPLRQVGLVHTGASVPSATLNVTPKAEVRSKSPIPVAAAVPVAVEKQNVRNSCVSPDQNQKSGGLSTSASVSSSSSTLFSNPATHQDVANCHTTQPSPATTTDSGNASDASTIDCATQSGFSPNQTLQETQIKQALATPNPNPNPTPTPVPLSVPVPVPVPAPVPVQVSVSVAPEKSAGKIQHPTKIPLSVSSSAHPDSARRSKIPVPQPRVPISS